MVDQFQFFMDKANIDFTVNLETMVAEILKARELSLAVAESITGGLLSERLTALPGSSSFFMGGVVCYSPRAKIIQTGIDPKIISEHGLVSEETALGLARGIRKRLLTDIGVSITGVAGPEPHGNMPVGTVFVAVATEQRDIVKEYDLAGDRAEIRRKSAQAAIGILGNLFKEE